MSNWWDNLTDDKISDLKDIVIPLGMLSLSARTAILAALPTGDVERYEGTEGWVALPSFYERSLTNYAICYRIRPTWEKPVAPAKLHWSTGLTPEVIKALKSITSPFGLLPTNTQALMQLIIANRDSEYYDGKGWIHFYIIPEKFELDNILVYRLRPDWVSWEDAINDAWDKCFRPLSFREGLKQINEAEEYLLTNQLDISKKCTF